MALFSVSCDALELQCSASAPWCHLAWAKTAVLNILSSLVSVCLPLCPLITTSLNPLLPNFYGIAYLENYCLVFETDFHVLDWT